MLVSNIIESNFLTYIAGILVPTLQISTTAAFNSVPTASVSLPPYPQLYGIGRKDRVPLHIFFKDPVDAEYYLFFEGEITDFSYSDAVYGRSITVNAQGVLAFLRDVNIMFMSSLDDIASANVSGAQDTALRVFSPDIMFPHSLFVTGLGKAHSDNLISVPYEYLQNVINFIVGGGAVPEPTMGNINNSALATFYAKYAEKLMLAQRYAPIPYFDDATSEVWPLEDDKPAARVFPLLAGVQKATALDQLTGLAGSAIQGGSAAHLLNYVVNQMEYEFSVVQSPSYIDNKALTMSLKPMFYDTMPPACNLLYRSMVVSVNSVEKVYGVATRVRTSDISGALVKLTNGVQSPITEYGLVDYFPSNKYKIEHVLPTAGTSGSTAALPNYIASELLDTTEDGGYDSERFTGPWVYETTAPSWQSYLGPNAIGANRDVFKARLLSRLLLHKQYEARTLQVSTVFTPYVIPGYPGVVYDSKYPGFTFCGHVYSVSHSISKTSLTSSLDMGFVRLVHEAVNKPVPSPVESMDMVLKDYDRMTEIYQASIGTSAVDWDEAYALEGVAAQDNLLASYTLQKRNIISMHDYFAFMGLEEELGKLPDGEEVPVILYGDFVEDRRDIDAQTVPPFEFEDGTRSDQPSSADGLEGIRKILRIIAEREFAKQVYANN